MHLLSVTLWMAAATAGQPGITAPGPAKDIPELEPLAHYQGVWDSTGTLKPTAAGAQGTQLKGSATAEWIHDGRFLRQTWTSTGAAGQPPISGTTIMTYDPHRKTYRNWSFTSVGGMGEGTGAWDPKTHTFTWTTRDPEGRGSAVTTATFAANGTESWSIVEKDGTGATVFAVEGKNTRRKAN